MAKNDIETLEKRHFEENGKKHNYCIFKDHTDFVVARGKNGCPSKEPCMIITPGVCKMYVTSPLSESDFSILAMGKSRDLYFWIRTIEKDKEEVDGDDD